MKKKPLHKLLVEQGLAPDRQKAESLVMAGIVYVDGEKAAKAGNTISEGAVLQVREGREYVGRGALKLLGALEVFKINVSERVCADAGSSTGGFTEVLLKNGARRVFAIDVGYGELDYKLRVDPRVVVMERTNARELLRLPEPVSVVTMDVSFISVTKLLPVARGWVDDRVSNDFVILVKPQFEAPKEKVEDGGVIRSGETRKCVLSTVAASAQALGYGILGLCRSAIKGGDGNIEYFMWLRPAAETQVDLTEVIAEIDACPSLE